MLAHVCMCSCCAPTKGPSPKVVLRQCLTLRDAVVCQLQVSHSRLLACVLSVLCLGGLAFQAATTYECVRRLAIEPCAQQSFGPLQRNAWDEQSSWFEVCELQQPSVCLCAALVCPCANDRLSCGQLRASVVARPWHNAGRISSFLLAGCSSCEAVSMFNTRIKPIG